MSAAITDRSDWISPPSAEVRTDVVRGVSGKQISLGLPAGSVLSSLVSPLAGRPRLRPRAYARARKEGDMRREAEEADVTRATP
ncbi:hypothetical protein BE20_51070 [Sorangium cellulosum]|uniref:Uncharacterized protein n=1 Tax=Sorangium cellulosum TaxID=56 RepID=A0A150TC90_SORCE|nr:hypothetical protein BE18_16005 [Sorangium cellulosum]KYG02322.1 hypothetical protein BE20_51070 [Sorangium cellulosum]